MGNLRDKYTDEEWEEIESRIETNKLKDKEYSYNWCSKIFYAEEQTNGFAIGFAEWMFDLTIREWENKTTKELLEIYKKEKAL